MPCEREYRMAAVKQDMHNRAQHPGSPEYEHGFPAHSNPLESSFSYPDDRIKHLTTPGNWHYNIPGDRGLDKCG